MQELISTNTNLVSFSRGGEKHTMLSLIPLYAEHGYTALDLNFCEMMNPHSAIDWEYIERLADLRDKYKLKYIQSHAPYFDYQRLSDDDRKKADDMIIRAMEYSKALGIPHIVIHPIRGSISGNISYFSSLLDRCEMKIGIENMESEDEIWRPEDLLEITEALKGNTGIVLDTGHAHMMGLSIPDFIKTTEENLIGTHIADNNGKEDQHLLPGFGTICWEETVDTFRKHYKGYLTYECMKFSAGIPHEAAGSIIELSLSISKYLLGL